MVSSVGSLGVPLSLTTTVPPPALVALGKVIAPVFGPLPPKSSFANTSILFDVLSSSTVAVSSCACGTQVFMVAFVESPAV